MRNCRRRGFSSYSEVQCLCLVRPDGGFPPCSVNNGRQESHDSHATENEQDLEQRVSVKNKGFTHQQIQRH